MSTLARSPTLARRASEGIRAAFVLASLVALTMVGCGEGKVDVSGNVTVDGAPVALGTIRFAPADGKGPTDGDTIQAGKYSVQLAPGNKNVHIEAYKQVGEKKHDPADPSSPMEPVYEAIISTEVTAEITASRDDLDFNLKSP